jgi:hypothetical protein
MEDEMALAMGVHGHRAVEVIQRHPAEPAVVDGKRGTHVLPPGFLWNPSFLSCINRRAERG